MRAHTTLPLQALDDDDIKASTLLTAVLVWIMFTLTAPSLFQRSWKTPWGSLLLPVGRARTIRSVYFRFVERPPFDIGKISVTSLCSGSGNIFRWKTDLSSATMMEPTVETRPSHSLYLFINVPTHYSRWKFQPESASRFSESTSYFPRRTFKGRMKTTSSSADDVSALLSTCYK